MKRILIAALLLQNLFAFAQPTDAAEQQIDALFASYSRETPGVAVAVVRDGAVLFKKGYGAANLEYDIPINTRTVFHVASVSKQFTAFAVYLLIDQGKLSPEDDIRMYLPEMPDFGKTIRIKHLLGHTSGLRDQWAMLTLAGWRMDDVITTDRILNLAIRQKALNFEPGTQFLYCNTGYTLLALIVERVCGQPFADFTKTHIFDPLGMADTRFYDDYQKLVKGRADSYEKSEESYVKKKLNYATVGATSLMTTVEDLAKWVSNFDHPKVGNPDLISEFDKISSLDNGRPVIWAAQPGDTTFHAKGQLHYYHKGVKVMSHGGHDAGFRATLTRFPEDNLAVIALSNDEHYNSFGNLMGIAEIYLKDAFVETAAPSGSRPAREENRFDLASDLSVFTGKYQSDELATEYEIKADIGILKMSHFRLGDMPLEQTGTDRFAGINSFPFEITFTRQGAGISGFSISNFGVKNVVFKKTFDLENNPLQPVPLIDRQLAAYNNRNLQAFLDTYSDDIRVYDFPDRLLGEGMEFMRSNYGELFRNAHNLHCEIQNRLVIGDTVIDHEKVTGLSDSGPLEVLAVYRISEGRIREVYFIHN